MTDLNKLRSEFEAQHSDKVFKIVKFDEATNAYCLHDHLPLTEINLSALAEINYGWDLWQKAKAQSVPEGYCLVPKEIPDSVVSCLENSGFHWGDGTRDHYTPIYSLMVEVASGSGAEQ
ncbi:hypothetical protein [Acinetobacter baumannii]|uniref:Phage protein n=1 Tax=Acinetobacter baumannii TaxID=470 RepID=A0A6B2QCH2_ACIBA|nr:hypothetical protein [Acinetobacter baumannii]NDN56611.1 hypothetical protein [Acinetobacter baumannii]NDX03102.1 hypothetical protein [Acinetobacter baumannii]NDX66578.1 hypothetical protein [Acinetobacter baumannii]